MPDTTNLKSWKWGYQIRGRKIYLYALDYYNRWVAPQLDIANGLKISYTTGSKAFVDSNGFSDDSSPDEDSILNCSDGLARAVIDFVKAKKAEDEGNQGLYLEYMRRYREKVSKTRDAIKGPRRVVPQYPFSFTNARRVVS